MEQNVDDARLYNSHVILFSVSLTFISDEQLFSDWSRIENGKSYWFGLIFIAIKTWHELLLFIYFE